MKPVSFKGANYIFTSPDPQTGDLPVNFDQEQNTCSSVWQLEAWEISQLLQTGRIKLTVWGGQPPVNLSVENE